MSRTTAILEGMNDAHSEYRKQQSTRDFSEPQRIGRYATIPVLRRDPIRTSGYSLIPPEPQGEVARVFQIGADKYEPRGWEKGLPWSDVVDRIHKHLGRWMRGEKYDLEDGQHNLASVAWAALVLMEFEKTHPECDDIHASTEVRPGIVAPLDYDTGSA